MMFRPKRLIRLLLVTMLLCSVSCKTRSELRREQEFEKMKQDLNNARGERADIDVEVDEIKTEVARLAASVDEKAELNRKQMDELKKAVDTLATRVQAIESRAVEQEMASRKAVEEASRVSYDNAKKLYDDGKWEDAEEMFRAVLKAKPKGEEAKKSRFYLAESAFNAKDYATAGIEFGNFEKAYPKAAEVPLAIYRQAHCFRSVGKSREAKLFYQELIDRFPKSSLASKARSEMRRLK